MSSERQFDIFPENCILRGHKNVSASYHVTQLVLLTKQTHDCYNAYITHYTVVDITYKDLVVLVIEQ